MTLRRYMTLSTLLLSAVLSGTSIGCREEHPPQASATSSRATPEESFKEIVRLVTDGIDVQNGGAVSVIVPGESASARIQIRNTVSSQIMPPGNENADYRGTITVKSTSTYSLRRTAEEAERKKSDDQSANGNRYNLLDDAEEDPGFESLDSQLITSGDNGRAAAETIEAVQRRSDENVRTYELAYENSRWVLVTKLDPETEKSISNAFKRALSLQP